MTDLTDQYGIDVDPDVESLKPEPERFVVDDDTKAQWALRKLAALGDEADQIAALAAAEIERITSWRDSQLGTIDRRAGFFRDLLVGYMHRLVDADPKLKTKKLPNGELTRRSGRASVEIADESVFVEWALQNAEELVRVKCEPVKAELSKLIAKDDGTLVYEGEAVPGVRLVAGAERFDAKPVT